MAASIVTGTEARPTGAIQFQKTEKIGSLTGREGKEASSQFHSGPHRRNPRRTNLRPLMDHISLLDALYRISRPLLFRLEAEQAHRIVLALMAAVPPMQPAFDPPELAQTIWGIDFRNPVGVAAGLDKDVAAVGAWQALGFAFA